MPNLDFKIRFSPTYCLGLLMMLGLSSAILIYLSMPFLLKSAILLSVLIYSAHLYWRYVSLQSPHSIVRLERDSEGNWRLHTSQQIVMATLCGTSTVTTQVAILRFQLKQSMRRQSCVIFADALLPEHYRQLLVALKMH